MAEVFISHATVEVAVARAIKAALAAEKIAAWVASDEIVPGQDWEHECTKAVEASRIVVLLLSAAANESKEVGQEVKQVQHRPIVPLRLQPVEPAQHLRHRLACMHWMDLGSPVTPTDLRLVAEAIRKLMKIQDDSASTGVSLSQQVAVLTSKVTLLVKRSLPEDRRVSDLLEKALTARGYKVHVDQRRDGTGDLRVWEQEMRRNIAESQVVAVLISAASAESDSLAEEVRIADAHLLAHRGALRILPVRVRFDGPFPSDLAGPLNREPACHWYGPEDDDRLVRDLLATIEQPSDPLAVAPPTGVLPLDSGLYILRPQDREMQGAVHRLDNVIRVRGARQVGKTSLVARALAQARAAGHRTVFMDFQQLNAADMVSIDTLFRKLAGWFVRSLALDIDLEKCWARLPAGNEGFGHFVDHEILGRVEGPLVWAMDEVDRLFPCPFRSEAFGLFRSWYNARVVPDHSFGRLTMIIAYATEAHLLIDNLNQSPFNVGTVLTLDDFTRDHLAELNRRHQAPLRSDADLDAFRDIVGGHPFLANRGFYALRENKWSLAEFRTAARAENGVFHDHLRRLLILLARDPALAAAMKLVLRNRTCRDGNSLDRLRSAGVIVTDADGTHRPRCQLYGDYLKKRLA